MKPHNLPDIVEMASKPFISSIIQADVDVCDDRDTVKGWKIELTDGRCMEAIPPEGPSVDAWLTETSGVPYDVIEAIYDLLKHEDPENPSKDLCSIPILERPRYVFEVSETASVVEYEADTAREAINSYLSDHYNYDPNHNEDWHIARGTHPDAPKDGWEYAQGASAEVWRPVKTRIVALAVKTNPGLMPSKMVDIANYEIHQERKAQLGLD